MTEVPATASEALRAEALDAAGLRWRVLQGGVGECTLLLHGTGGTAHTWDALAPYLLSSHRLVALDLPGHGSTSFPGFERIACDSMADMVAAALRALGISPAHVVGHSAGAAIMLTMAATGVLPASTRLVGINPALDALPDRARTLMRGPIGQLFRSSLSRSVVRVASRAAPVIELLLASTGSRLTPQQERAYVDAFQSGDHAEAAYAMMANWDLAPLRRALPSIGHETLFIVGAHDRWIAPDVARRAAALMPRARVHVIPDAGHLVHEENPAGVAALIGAAAARGVGDDAP